MRRHRSTYTQSFNALKTIADVLDGYAGYPGADLYQHPKFRRMFTGGPRIVALDAYIPSIGDAGATGQPGIGFTADTYVTGFERYGDPSMAQLAYLLNKNSTVGLNSGIFSPDPAGTEDKIRTLITTDGPLDRPTENMTGYGLGWLRSGAVGTPARQEAWIYYAGRPPITRRLRRCILVVRVRSGSASRPGISRGHGLFELLPGMDAQHDLATTPSSSTSTHKKAPG